MSRPGAITSPRLAALLLVLTAALGQLVGAQSAPPRPNVAMSQIASLYYSVFPADIDRDGKVDLIGTDIDTGGHITAISFRHGNGDGTFGPRTTAASINSAAVGVGDFNGDGKLDILVREFAVIPGRGDG